MDGDPALSGRTRSKSPPASSDGSRVAGSSLSRIRGVDAQLAPAVTRVIVLIEDPTQA
jgi:hypothetical protein